MSGGASLSLSYDPMDRLYETAGTVTRRYLYDGANVIAEYDTSGAIVNRYVQSPGADEQLVWWAGSAMADRRFEVNDERNSVIIVTDGCTSPAFALRAPGPSPEGEGGVGRLRSGIPS